MKTWVFAGRGNNEYQLVCGFHSSLPAVIKERAGRDYEVVEHQKGGRKMLNPRKPWKTLEYDAKIRRNLQIGGGMSTGKKVALVIGVVFVLGIIMQAIENRDAAPRSSSSRQTQTTTDRAATTRQPTAEHPTLGEKGVLRIDGGGRVPICATQAVHDRLQKLSNVNDVAGIEQLIRLGNIRMVKGGTRVHVLSTDWTQFEVRILDGSRVGHSGFVKRDFVWSH